jgi:hypothetical protein
VSGCKPVHVLTREKILGVKEGGLLLLLLLLLLLAL